MTDSGLRRECRPGKFAVRLRPLTPNGASRQRAFYYAFDGAALSGKLGDRKVPLSRSAVQQRPNLGFHKRRIRLIEHRITRAMPPNAGDRAQYRIAQQRQLRRVVGDTEIQIRPPPA